MPDKIASEEEEEVPTIFIDRETEEVAKDQELNEDSTTTLTASTFATDETGIDIDDDYFLVNDTSDEFKTAEKDNVDDGLTLQLVPLPLLTDDGKQTPIGARGWYASAVLSSMMLLCEPGSLLHQDLRLSGEKTTTNSDIHNNDDDDDTRRPAMMIELGSGTIGLVGMNLAWIVAQQHQLETNTKIVLTDYDHDVLAQLHINVQKTQKCLHDHFGRDDTVDLPQIEVAHLDWNEYDQKQPLLNDSFYNITFVCGAALVYTDDTVACADQVAKILKLHPQAAVWVVQWPRMGWFEVFQMQLQQKHGCRVQKFVPARDIHERVHDLAKTFMPPQLCLDVDNIKAVRITSG